MIAVLMCFFREIPRFSKEKWLNMFLELIQYAHRIILNSVFLLYTYKESAISHLFTIQSRQQQEWFNLLLPQWDHFHRVSLLDNAPNYLVGCVIQNRWKCPKYIIKRSIPLAYLKKMFKKYIVHKNKKVHHKKTTNYFFCF